MSVATERSIHNFIFHEPEDDTKDTPSKLSSRGISQQHFNLSNFAELPTKLRPTAVTVENVSNKFLDSEESKYHSLANAFLSKLGEIYLIKERLDNLKDEKLAF